MNSFLKIHESKLKKESKIGSGSFGVSSAVVIKRVMRRNNIAKCTI